MNEQNVQIIQRIARDLGVSDLTGLLAEKLSGSDLYSLLLAVLKQRVAKIEPSKLTQFSPVSKSCNLDGRVFNELEHVAFEAASGYDAIELSPVSPLGAISVLTGLDQSKILSTVRAFECASDPTIGLALECACRRKNSASRQNIIRLCTNQRVLRFPVPENPAFTAHFKLFSLVSAGRDLGSFSFEVAALQEHIDTYLSLLFTLATEGFAFKDIVVEISDTRVVSYLCSMFNISRDEIRAFVRASDSNSSAKLLEKYSITWPMKVTKPVEELAQYNLPKHLLMHLNLLEKEVCARLGLKYSNVQFIFNMQRLTGLGYYNGPCFHIKMTNGLDQTFMLADGGFVDWMQLLLCDDKERLMTSAIGTELLCRMFRRV